jgi:hypothetical protein
MSRKAPLFATHRAFVLAEQLALDPLTDQSHLASLLFVECVERAPFDDAHVHDVLYAREPPLHSEGAVLGFVDGMGRTPTPEADRVLPLDHADTGDILLDGLDIIRFQLNLAACRHPLIWQLRHTLRPDEYEIGDWGKAVLDAIFQSSAGS